MQVFRFEHRCLWVVVLSASWLAPPVSPAFAQSALPGEFTDIELGREILGTGKFPTIAELRAKANNESVEKVMMLRLFTDENMLHVPNWSPDGQRLAFQRTKGKAAQGGTSTSSRLFVFQSLGDAAPEMLKVANDGADDGAAYDYMFRWERTGQYAFAFVRLEPGQATYRLYVSPDGFEATAAHASNEAIRFPELYRHPNRAWALVYGRDGTDGAEVVVQYWQESDDARPVPRRLTDGNMPRWNSRGDAIVFLRDRQRAGGSGLYVHPFAGDKQIEILRGSEDSVRGPTWSPGDDYVAYYVSDGRRAVRWRLEVCPSGRAAQPLTVADNVVVNGAFRSQGPTWSPNGRQIWFFSEVTRQGTYYPLVSFDIQKRSQTTIDYFTDCLSARDVAVNPASQIPEVAFVGQRDKRHELFVLVLNHF